MFRYDSQNARNMQIDSMLSHFTGSRPVTQDRSLIDVPVILKNNAQLIFRVHIPAAFPSQGPTVQLMARATHKYLDQNSFVTHPVLKAWTAYSNIIATLIDIFKEFASNPPNVTSYAPPNPVATHQPVPTHGMPGGPMPQRPGPQVHGYGNTPGYGTHGYGNPAPVPGPTNGGPPTTGSPAPAAASPPPQPTHIQMPVIPASFPDLQSKSVEELTEIVNGGEAFDNYFDSLECINTVKALKESMTTNVSELANKNLEKEAELAQLNSEIDDVRSRIDAKNSQFEEYDAKRQEILRQYAPAVLLERLRAATKEADEQSEEIAEKYLSGSIDLNAFIEQYIQTRSLYYVRNQKKDSFQQTF